MNVFLACLRIGGAGLVGLVLGALAGFFGLFAFAQAYVAMGGDQGTAAALSFFSMVTLPAGALLGAIAGVILAIRARRRAIARQGA
jgi:hypothetical protein